MSLTKQIIIIAAILAYINPKRVAASAAAAGEVGRQLGSGISALGSVQIRPALSPEFAPRFAPEIDIPGVDLAKDYSIREIFSRIGSREDVTDPTTESSGDDPLSYERQVPSSRLVSGEDDYGD
tara:strand:- start:272 stop:643 length:372 start_codon:yes stop_codon:yes gene_type:complete